jgi:hypothetical protein
MSQNELSIISVPLSILIYLNYLPVFSLLLFIVIKLFI